MGKDSIGSIDSTTGTTTGSDGASGDSRYIGMRAALSLVDDVASGRLTKNGVPTSVLSIAGSPRSGKTTLCFEAFVAPERADLVRQGRSVLVVSHRTKADALSNEAVTRVGNSVVSRPVKTLVALAFSILKADRAQHRQLPPKLLNGAEQDQIIDEVLAVHVSHAERGDDCPTCALLRRYFSVREDDARQSGPLPSATEDEPRNPSRVQTTADIFRQMMTPAFAAQLRDMFARMAELHFSLDDPQELERCEERWGENSRECVEWKLAAQLRLEYAQRVETDFPEEYRIDSSYILVEAENSIVRMEREELDEESSARHGLLPEFVIVDDSQDLTLAGFSFLQRLVESGTKLLLVGNDDESVQSFRGAYPEVISALSAAPEPTGMNAARVELEPLLVARRGGEYLTQAVARISQGIGSVMVNEVPVPQRPGKLPAVPVLPEAAAGGSLRGRLFRSPAEELDDLVWNLKSTMCERDDVTWRDFAVIAHDNTTLRAIGKRCEEEDIPVSYSSVTRPLKEETVVQGLLALLQLVRLAQASARGDSADAAGTADATDMADAAGLAGVASTDRSGKRENSGRVIAGEDAAWVRSLFERVAASPLVQVPSPNTGSGISSAHSLRVGRLLAALSALAVLEGLSNDAGEEQDPQARERFRVVRAEWERLTGAPSRGSLGAEGLLTVLLIGEEPARRTVLTLLNAVLVRGRRRYRSAQADTRNADDSSVSASASAPTATSFRDDPEVEAVRTMTRIIWGAQKKLATARTGGVHAALWYVWDACGVAEQWRTESLIAGRRGLAANRLLDTVIRLFSHAQAAAEEGIEEFIQRISALDIEADSLAKVAPQENSVMLATPAGASGMERRFIWIPAMQQDVWPNLTPRNTLFGAEILADTVLSGRLRQLSGENSGTGAGAVAAEATVDSVRPRLATLYSEMKSLLVALTRGTEQVTVSAVSSDEFVPSEFLSVFLSEIFPREEAENGDDDAATPLFTQVGGPDTTVAAATAAATDAAGAADGSDAADGSVEPSAALNRGGLDASARGLVALARARLVRYYQNLQASGGTADGSFVSEQTLPAEVRDAVETLRYLADRGVKAANPSEWTFVNIPRAGAQTTGAHIASPQINGASASNDAAASVDTVVQKNADNLAAAENSVASEGTIEVTLSPSSVDGLWQCPLKWAMENKYNGPRQGSTATGFGTLIHDCAQFATEKGWDREKSQEELCRLMLEHFKELRALHPAPNRVEDAYAVGLQNRNAEAVLSNIATYFVEGRDPNYGIKMDGGKERKNEMSPAGTVSDVEAEKEFRATFALSDFVGMLRNIDGLDTVSGAELAAVLTTLAQGFDADFSQKARITLSGRIDRLEHRVVDGEEVLHVVDYKTGKHHTAPEIFSDLQLICYQLGLLFTQNRADGRTVERSMLFDVQHRSQPAFYKTAEVGYQPTLFSSTRTGFNATYRPRPSLPRIDSVFTDTKKEAVTDAFAALDRLGEAAAENDQLMWCLSMVARIFYAAGYRQADRFTPKRGPQCAYCAFKSICPAWPDESETVYGAVGKALMESVSEPAVREER